ncbi:MAG TPA: hypothetical protein PKZ08_16420, partial [Vicinamibacterales bacterium]|nr:hypothetical protein [Vicinamibacterales bacterium]
VFSRDAGAISRDANDLKFKAIEAVDDTSTAGTRAFTTAGTTVNLSGTPAAGETWTLTVDGTPYSHTVGGATTAKATFAGTPVAGNIWTVRVDGTNYSATVAAGQTLAQVVGALAAAIDAASGYTASAEGDVLAVVKTAGGAMTLTATLPAGATSSIDGTTALTSTVTLSGTPAAGDTWWVVVDGAGYSHVVTAGQTLAQVAAALAAQINGAEGYTASAEGAVINVTELAGTSVDGKAPDVSASLPAGASSTVAATETLAQVLAALASSIDGAGGYAAWVEDSTIRITRLDGATPAVAATLPDRITKSVDTGTTGHDRIDLAWDGAKWAVASLDGTFVDFTFKDPTGTLTVNAGAGNDAITVGAAAKTNGLAIDGGTGTDRVFYEVQAGGSAQDVKFGATDVKLNDNTVFSFANVESGKNLVVEATGGAEHIDFAASGSRYTVSTTSGTFATVTLDDPGAGGSLTIRAGAGDDTLDITGISSLTAGLNLEGGDGADVLNLGAGTFSSVAFAADIETVNADSATVADFVFDGRPAIANRITSPEVVERVIE